MKVSVLVFGLIACIACGAVMSGCSRSYFGVVHYPERQYYHLFAEHYGVKSRMVKHVKVQSKGMSILGYPMDEPDIRPLIEKELSNYPDAYIANLQIHTDSHRTTPLIAGFVFLPQIDAEFDIVEVVGDGSLNLKR